MKMWNKKYQRLQNLKELQRKYKQGSRTLLFALGTSMQWRINISSVFNTITRMFMAKFTLAACTTPIIRGKFLQNWKFNRLKNVVPKFFIESYWYRKLGALLLSISSFWSCPNAVTAKFRRKKRYINWNTTICWFNEKKSLRLRKIIKTTANHSTWVRGINAYLQS